MSTNSMSDWAVDLAEVGAIYPFQGSEGLLVILGVVFWIGWHVIQMRQEKSEVGREMKADPEGKDARDAIDRY